MPNPPPRSRPAAAVLIAALLVSCTSGGTPAATESSTDVVLEAREILGDPLLELAEATLALSDGIDAARHTLPRGKDMQRGLRQLRGRLQRVGDAIAGARAAAGEAGVEDAAAIVEEAAATAADSRRAAAGEIAFLTDVGAIDVALLAAAAQWDRPGSQSEIRARLSEVADRVAALRQRAARLRPQPPGCTAMRANRREWVTTVRSRTLELQSQANSAGGTEFDLLRSRYRALPLAVEPRTADRAGRDCWLQQSRVAKAAPAMRAAVDELREALSG